MVERIFQRRRVINKLGWILVAIGGVILVAFRLLIDPVASTQLQHAIADGAFFATQIGLGLVVATTLATLIRASRRNRR